MLNTRLTQEQIKQLNRVKIIRFIRSKSETTKQEIGSELGLSIPTVTSNINDLIEEGLITEAGVAVSTGGRKPVILRFLENARYAIGVSIRPKKVEVILQNLNAETVDSFEFDYREEVGFEGVLSYLSTEVLRMLENNHVKLEKVLGIGLALPGRVDDSEKMLYNAPNINVSSYNFQSFEEEIGLPVFIENEANVAAYAEIQLDKMKAVDNLVYISVTEGIGTGIIIHNHIYKGTRNRAGEFGHHRISDEKRKCNCGRMGCFELYASNSALLRYYNEQSIVKFTSIAQIFEEYHQSNMKAKEAVERYIEYLMKGIENIILGLSPDYLVIGGEIAKYRKEIMMIGGIISKNSKEIEYEGSKIIFSELVDKGALMGAALLPLEEVFNYKSNIL